jgi:hypothetical protein
MEVSQHSLLAACFTLHSINATLAIVPQCGNSEAIIVELIRTRIAAGYEAELIITSG